MMTVAPSFASSRAMANPIPVPPPVIIPTRFSNVFSGSMARDDTSGREVAFQRGDHRRQVVHHCLPQKVDVNLSIAVKEPITHSGDAAPIEFNCLSGFG